MASLHAWSYQPGGKFTNRTRTTKLRASPYRRGGSRQLNCTSFQQLDNNLNRIQQFVKTHRTNQPTTLNIKISKTDTPKTVAEGVKQILALIKRRNINLNVNIQFDASSRTPEDQEAFIQSYVEALNIEDEEDNADAIFFLVNHIKPLQDNLAEAFLTECATTLSDQDNELYPCQIINCHAQLLAFYQKHPQHINFLTEDNHALFLC